MKIRECAVTELVPDRLVGLLFKIILSIGEQRLHVALQKAPSGTVTKRT